MKSKKLFNIKLQPFFGLIMALTLPSGIFAMLFAPSAPVFITFLIISVVYMMWEEANR